MKNKKPKEIKASVSKDILRGVYSNAFKISINNNESYIDFAFIFEQDGEDCAEVVSRIILRPEFAVKMAKAILEISEKHKQKNEKK